MNPKVSVSRGAQCLAVAGSQQDVKLAARLKAYRLPLDDLKAIVEEWQIITMFSRISRIEYPPSLSGFLLWINVVNHDVET